MGKARVIHICGTVAVKGTSCFNEHGRKEVAGLLEALLEGWSGGHAEQINKSQLYCEAALYTFLLL